MDTPAAVLRSPLVSQCIAPPLRAPRVRGPYPPYVHSILHFQPQLPGVQGQIAWEGIGLWVQLRADSLEQQVWPVAQQGVPIVSQVELPVLPPRVYFVDADKLSVSRVTGKGMKEYCSV